MRSYSSGYRVSPSAVHEMIGRVDLWFETHMKELCDVTKTHGRHTIMDDDVTEFFSKTKSVFLDG
jgi:histone H3/H4